MEENKINNIEEIEEVEETEMETKPKGFGAKVVGGFKKHGKKVWMPLPLPTISNIVRSRRW